MKNLLYFLLAVLIVGSTFAQDKDEYPKVNIHGLTFGDFFYNASASNPANKDINGVRINRVYLTGDFGLSQKFSSRFRLETDQIGNGGETDPGTKNGPKTEFGVMVKDAWLKWQNIFSGSDLIFGISPTPAFDVSEGAWGHRYLEKTIMDLDHIVGSRDMGIDLKGKFDEKGSVKYWLKIGNNSGNSPEANKYKRYYGMLEFDPSSSLLITVYGDYASASQIVDPFDNTAKDNSSFVGAAFVNFKQKGSFSIGIEGFISSTQNKITSTTAAAKSLSANGISVWAYVDLSETVQIVGRFDTFDPNSDTSNDGTSLIIAGIQFNPIKTVSVTPNVEVFSHQASGVDSDVTPRVSFYWVF